MIEGFVVGVGRLALSSVAVEAGALIGFKALENQRNTAAKIAKFSLVVLASLAAVYATPCIALLSTLPAGGAVLNLWALFGGTILSVSTESAISLTWHVTPFLIVALSLPVHAKAFELAGILSANNAQA